MEIKERGKLYFSLQGSSKKTWCLSHNSQLRFVSFGFSKAYKISSSAFPYLIQFTLRSSVPKKAGFSDRFFLMAWWGLQALKAAAPKSCQWLSNCVSKHTFSPLITKAPFNKMWISLLYNNPFYVAWSDNVFHLFTIPRKEQHNPYVKGHSEKVQIFWNNPF